MKKILIKNDVLTMLDGIKAIMSTGEKYNPNFYYALCKNMRSIKDTVESIQETIKNNSNEYKREARELGVKFALKNEKGDPIVKSNGYKLDPDLMYSAQKAMDELDEKYKSDLEANAKFLKEEVEVELQMIKRSTLPDLQGDMAYAIFDMVIDDSSEDSISEGKDENKQKINDNIYNINKLEATKA